MGSDSEHQAVLDVLAGCRAVDAPPGLEDRVRAAVQQADVPVGFAAVYGAYRDDAYGLVLRVLGDEALARETVEDAFFELQRDLDERAGLTWPEALAFVCAATREAHRLACKARRAPAEGPLAQLDVDDQLLLLCRGELGLSPLELTRALGVKIEPDLDSVAASLSAALSAPSHAAGREFTDLVVRRALGLDLDGQANRLSDHIAACTVCAVQAERLQEELSVPLIKLPDPEAIAEAVANRGAKDREHKAAVFEVVTKVSLNCTYCHSSMLRRETAFCSTCLAPHHEDCFTEHGRCSAPGCGETIVVKPINGGVGPGQPVEAPEETPKRRRGWLVGGIAILIGGGLVAAWGAAFSGWPRDREELGQRDYIQAELDQIEREKAEALQQELRQQLERLRVEKQKEIENLRAKTTVGDDEMLEMARRYDIEKKNLQRQIEALARGEDPDRVVLKSGKEIVGDIVRVDPEKVVTRTKGGTISVARAEVAQIIRGNRVPELLAKIERLEKARAVERARIERLEAEKLALEASRQKAINRWRSFEKEAEKRGLQLPENLVQQMRADMGVLDDDMKRMVEERFAKIEKLASERKVEELIAEFTQLRALMSEFGKSGSDQVKKAMAKWNQRLETFGQVQLSIQLQIYINEGNQYLQSMAAAVQAKEHKALREAFGNLVELREQMFAEEREVFHRNSEALWTRGRAMALKGGALAGKIAAIDMDPGYGIRLEGEDTHYTLASSVLQGDLSKSTRHIQRGMKVLLFFEDGAQNKPVRGIYRDSSGQPDLKAVVGTLAAIQISEVLRGTPSSTDLDSWIEIEVDGVTARYTLPDSVVQARRALLDSIRPMSRVSIAARGKRVVRISLAREPSSSGISVEVIGVYERIEEVAGRRLLFLKGGRLLRVPADVYQAHERIWPFIKKGDKVTYEAEDDVLVKLRVGS